MPKERTINPAQAARKADKAKALKKSKSEKHARQNEKLARRNPERLQRQIDELKELETSSTNFRAKDRQTLEQLEKDLVGIKRAREALGDRAPVFGSASRVNNERKAGGGGDDGGRNLGKRRRDDQNAYGGNGSRRQEPESETDDEVRGIPMPRDTPPPIPRRGGGGGGARVHGQQQQQSGDGAAAAVPAPAPAKTVYSSAPVLRNLAQESRRFVPAAVAQNLARQRGEGGRLLEPEELDKLEKAGYGDAARAAEEATEEAAKEATHNMMNAAAADDPDGDFDVDKEAERFEKELKSVEMEEVPDEDL